MRTLPDVRTVGEAVEACRRRLRSVSETPWLDARLLAQHVTGLDASALIAYGESTLDPHRRQRLFQLVERRAAGEPVAYLVGKKSFCGLDLSIDKRVLVPRPETEELVMACVADWTGTQARIADVGTGSGAIACALAHLLPDALVIATDSSPDALELAQGNAVRLGLSEQIAFVHGDLLTPVPEAVRFDAIVANLPYVAEDQSADLSPAVRAHEPLAALLAGPDGLDVYARLLPSLPGRLKPEAAVYCECAPSNARALAAMVGRTMPESAIEVKSDLAGQERIVVARLRARSG